MRAWGLALLATLTAGAALAQDGSTLAPERVPAPEARPEAEGATVPQLIPPEEMEAVSSAPGGENDAPAEPERAEPPAGREPEEGLSFGLEGEAEAPPDTADEIPRSEDEASVAPDDAPEKPEEDPGPPMREVLAETEAELSACLAALDELGVAYKRAEPISDAEDRDCGIVNPLTVSEITPGVALEPPPTMRCDAALAAARWVTDVALPLSRKLEGRGRLIALDQGTAYLCRPRADGETSEHAYGNALDVMSFRFETGDPIVVQPRADDGTLEEAFQTAVRGAACLDFTTVLGPGQPDHDDHLHLDVKEREGGFRICQ
jgi:hypothetical protein